MAEIGLRNAVSNLHASCQNFANILERTKGNAIEFVDISLGVFPTYAFTAFGHNSYIKPP